MRTRITIQSSKQTLFILIAATHAAMFLAGLVAGSFL
jgi:hypothetical protein